MTKHIHDPNDFIVSHDLPLVAYLSTWFPIENIDRSKQKVDFVFKRNIELDELVVTFWRREAQIEPIGYFNQIKVIKSMIYE